MDINLALTTVKLPDGKEELLALIEQCQAQIESINKAEKEHCREEQKSLDAQYRKEFGARLKVARKRKDLRQKDVAEKLGITPTAYSNYERGARDLPPYTIYRLTQIFDVSADYLLGLTENFKGD